MDIIWKNVCRNGIGLNTRKHNIFLGAYANIVWLFDIVYLLSCSSEIIIHGSQDIGFISCDTEKNRRSSQSGKEETIYISEVGDNKMGKIN